MRQVFIKGCKMGEKMRKAVQLRFMNLTLASSHKEEGAISLLSVFGPPSKKFAEVLFEYIAQLLSFAVYFGRY